MTVAIVGQGIVGASCARWLAEAGHNVTAFDPYTAGHDRGSSHGDQKIVRKAYPDPFYTAILAEAHGLWNELAQSSRRRVVTTVGLAMVGPLDGDVGLSASSLAQHGVAHRIGSGADVPFAVLPGEAVLLTPDAGWADTRESLSATLELAERAGAIRIEHRVESLHEIANFDVRIIAAGPWVRQFLDLPVTVTCQTSAYIDGTYEGPVWIEGFGAMTYGFPNRPGVEAYKVGYHTSDVELDPEELGRPVSPHQLDEILASVGRRFPGSDRRIVSSFGCLYTSTRDDSFRIGWADAHTIVASPCSGHGFKFAPWVGQLVAGMVAGTSEPPARFAQDGLSANRPA